MTRDEAIDRFASAVHNPLSEYFSETVERVIPMIDGFIALGMLAVEDRPSQVSNGDY